jgi:hypothetical protein
MDGTEAHGRANQFRLSRHECRTRSSLAWRRDFGLAISSSCLLLNQSPAGADTRVRACSGHSLPAKGVRVIDLDQCRRPTKGSMLPA